MGAASSSQRTFEDAEEWEDQSFHHEYAQPGPATWDEEEEEDESSVSIHLGPRLVRRLQQRRGVPTAVGSRTHTERRAQEPKEQATDELDFGLPAVLPPPLSEEELESLTFSTLPPLGDVEGEGEQQEVRVPRPTTTAADREFAQREAEAVRQQYRAEQQRLRDEEMEQLHRLRGLVDSMTRHRRASGESCEAERSACLECYAKEQDPLACASRVRAFKQCATTTPKRTSTPV